MGKFTAEEIQIAKAVDLVDLAEQIGIPLKRKAGSIRQWVWTL